MFRKTASLLIMLSLLLAAFSTLVISVSALASNSEKALNERQPGAAIEQELLDTLAAEGRADFFVVMAEKVDLSTAHEIQDWSERGWYVYNALTKVAKRSQSSIIEYAEKHDLDYKSFFTVNSVYIKGGNLETAHALADLPGVQRLRLEGAAYIQLGAAGVSPDAYGWNLDTLEPDNNLYGMQAAQVWGQYGIKGAGIVVANIDTGVYYEHEALDRQYRGNLTGDIGGPYDHDFNWYMPTSGCGNGTYPCDNDGHGSGTIGIMAGETEDLVEQTGVAPKAQWIACKGCEASSCPDAALTGCADWMVAPCPIGVDPGDPSCNPDMRPHIINNSWGGSGCDTWYQGYVQAWVAAGQFPAFSAGNSSGCGTLGSPGDYPESFGTAAHNSTGSSLYAGGPSCFFSTPSCDPGAHEIAPHLNAPTFGRTADNSQGAYYHLSGTSGASPHTAGVVALIWSGNPSYIGQVYDTFTVLEQSTNHDVPAGSCGKPACAGAKDWPNYDYGWGYLDALGAVEMAGTGGIGYLAGTVTDGVLQATVADATIQATLSLTQSRQTTSDNLGQYTMSILSGTYTIDAWKYGHQPAQYTGIQVISGTTTTQDIVLPPVTFYTVDGTVIDATTGWPLYASIDIDGHPGGGVWTDPETGYYSISLPEGTIYTFYVNAWSPGYQTESRDVGPLTGNISEDWALQTGSSQSCPPGYAEDSIFYDGFETGSLGSSWTVMMTNEGRVQVDTSDPHMGDYSALLDDSVDGSLYSVAGIILTQDLSAESLVYLDFWWHEYSDEDNPEDGVFISDDSGTTWCQVLSFNGGPSAYRHAVVDLTAALPGCGMAFNANFQILFQGYDNYSIPVDGYTIDEVRLTKVVGISCVPIPGGLVVGNVYDDNTNVPLVGAGVENKDGYAATAVETSDDPAVDDAFYILFSPAGTTTFAATMSGGYAPDVDPVTVVQSDTVSHDFELPAGLLAHTPPTLAATLGIGNTAVEQLTLDNLGGLALDYEITEMDGSFAPATAAGSGHWLYRAEEAVSLPTSNGGAALAYPSAYRWELDSPSAVNILIYADDPVHTPPNTFLDQALQALGLPYTAHYDGDFVGFQTNLTTGGPWDLVLVGHDNVGGLGTCFTDLNNYVAGGGKLAINTWEMGTDPGHALWTTMGTTFIGNDGDPPNPVYWWEPGHSLFNTPESVPELTSLDGGFYGIYGQHVEPLARFEALAGYTTPGPDPNEATLILGNNNRTIFKGFLDGQNSADLNGNTLPDGVELWINLANGLLYGLSADMDWLAQDPVSGTLSIAGQQIVDITFDAGAPSVTQPGKYYTTLKVNNDTPYGALEVPVTMTVTAPADWGKLNGAVISLGYCDANSAVLESAQVHIESSQMDTMTVVVSTSVLAENFETWLPTGWLTVNNGADCVWASTATTGETNYAGGDGEAADANSDACGNGTTMDTELWTPAMDLSGYVSATLDFVASYRDVSWTSADYFEVDVSSDGGGAWTNVLSWAGSSHDGLGPGEAVSIDLAPYLSANVVVRFRYVSPGWNWWAQVDQVRITGLSEIEIQTPIFWDIETDGNGYYQVWMDHYHSPLTVTVTYPAHEDGEAASVSVTAQATTTQSFELRWLAPCVSTDPASLHAYMELGQTATLPFTLANTGIVSTTYELAEGDRGFEPVWLSRFLPLYVAPTIRSKPAGGDSYSGGGYQPWPADIVPSAPARYRGPDALVFYGDRGAFDTDFPGLLVEGFENTLVADGSIVACPGPFDSATDNACFAPGGILDGIRLMNSVPMNDMIVVGDGALGNPTALAGPNTIADQHDITFYNGGVNAVGFDLWVPTGAATFDIYIYGPGDVLLGQTTVAASTTGTFWGVYSGNPITRIRTESGSGGELFDDIAFGIAGDVPWLTANPVSGTLSAGTDQIIDVEFDASAPKVDQPGDYMATLSAQSDDPVNGRINIPVTMTVSVPDTWGKLVGTVMSPGHCDAAPTVLENAEIAIEASNGMTWTLETDANGYYQRWLDEAYSPMTLTVTCPDHKVGQLTDIMVSGQMTTTKSVKLRSLEPCVSASPSYLEVTVMRGASETLPLNLNNDGAGTTPFEMMERERMVWPPALGKVLSRTGNDLDDVSPNYHEVVGPLAVGDELFQVDAESSTGHRALLGVEWADGYYWVTSAGLAGSGDPNYLFQLDKDGNVVNSWLQSTTSTWGWRDLAFDGAYLYASDSSVVEQIDPVTGSTTGTTIPCPSGLNPCRALAYDPTTDHFWTASWDSNIYEFDRSGVVINSFPNTLSAYGMAWDAWSPGSQYLWVWSQDGSPQVLATQIDPATGARTGAAFVGSAAPGGGAGGATIINGDHPGFSSMLVFAGMHQATSDTIVGYDLDAIAAGDVPWLDEDPITGDLPADGRTPISVTFTALPAMTAGIYTAILVVKTDDPVNGTIDVPVTMAVVYAPVCDFETSSPDDLGMETTFTNNTDEGNALTTYRWNFGDGSAVSAATHPTHTYGLPGLYTAALTTENPYGVDVCTDTVSVEGVVAGFISNSPVIRGEEMAFTNTTAANPDVVNWFWTFGDGKNDDTENPTHIYVAAGTYTVTLFAATIPGGPGTSKMPENVYDLYVSTVKVITQCSGCYIYLPVISK